MTLKASVIALKQYVICLSSFKRNTYLRGASLLHFMTIIITKIVLGKYLKKLN